MIHCDHCFEATALESFDRVGVVRPDPLTWRQVASVKINRKPTIAHTSEVFGDINVEEFQPLVVVDN